MHDVFIYKFHYSGNKKVLSAWFKFQIDGVVRNINFIDSDLYVVINRNGQTLLEKISLAENVTDPIGHNTYLDFRFEARVGSGPIGGAIQCPYTPKDTDNLQVYTEDGAFLASTRDGTSIQLNTEIPYNDDGTRKIMKVYVGIPYEMSYEFSEMVFKQGQEPRTANPNTKIMVRNGTLQYSDSSHFEVHVTPKMRDTNVNVFSSNVVGESIIGDLNLDTGEYRFPVMTKPQDTKIVIKNNSALPSNIQSCEFESFTHGRARRI